MDFNPPMLPAAYWKLVIEDLSNHFGEDASLDDETVEELATYIYANSADAIVPEGVFLRGVNPANPVLRITDTPFWIIKHEKAAPLGGWVNEEVKSKSNCLACHEENSNVYFGN